MLERCVDYFFPFSPPFEVKFPDVVNTFVFGEVEQEYFSAIERKREYAGATYHEELRKLTESFPQDSQPSPFLILEGSSGTGKTQQGVLTRNALYFTWQAVPLERMQHIYQAFNPASDAFRNCIWVDFSNWKRENRADGLISATALLEDGATAFFSLGLLKFLVSECLRAAKECTPEAQLGVCNTLRGQVIKIAPISLREFRIWLFTDAQKALKSVVLDEATVSSRTNAKDHEYTDAYCKLIFVRNMLRAAGPICVVMGTESSAMNALFMPKDHSRLPPGAIKTIWCSLLRQTNNFVVDVIDDARILSCLLINPLLHYVFQGSRPLLVKYAIQWLQSDFLSNCSPGTLMPNDWDRMLQSVYKTLLTQKTAIWDTSDGRCAQLLFLVSNLYSQSGVSRCFKEESCRLLQQHLGILHPSAAGRYELDADNENLVLVKEGTSEPIKLLSLFPSPKEDLLLHMCARTSRLVGVKQTRVFCRTAIEDRNFHCADYGRARLHAGNVHARRNEGDDLEVAACAAMLLSTRSVSGTPLPEFVASILDELSAHEERLTESDVKVLDSFKFRVPLFSAVGSKWPQFVADLGCFANLDRCRNKESLDFVAAPLAPWSPRITGEMKNYEGAISSDVLAGVLARTPMNSNLHIVFASHLQNSYSFEPSQPRGDKWNKQVEIKNNISVHSAAIQVLQQFQVIVVHKQEKRSDPAAPSSKYIFSGFNAWKPDIGSSWRRDTSTELKKQSDKLILILEVGSINIPH